MKVWLMLVLISTQARALDAVVTVLETPMLKTNSLEAPVVQYLRKGDVIKIHPSINNTDEYDHLAPDPKKLAEIQKELDESPEWQQDPLFRGKPTSVAQSDEFIPTLDRQGNTVYVIREHLYIYYTSPKEFDQVTLQKDPTDYRLEEPLPKRYPIYSTTGYRGQFLLGMTQPNTESYPYRSNVKTEGYSSPIDVNVTLMRQAPDDKFDRFFLGINLNLRTFTNSYTLYNGNTTKETGFKFGVGPHISYDAFKGVKNRLNLYGVVNVNLFNQLNVLQKNASIEEQRNYRAINISPRLGVQYHRKQVLEDIDFVLGTSMEMEPATTFRSNSAANQGDWWVNRGSDKFKSRTTFTLAGYLGVQSAY
jgi:hypothetical protein